VSGLLPLLAQSPATFIALSGVLGLLVGSFLNVVIYRLPRMLERQWRAECADFAASLAATPAALATPAAPAIAEAPPAFNLLVPGSSCPSCHEPIRAIHNIPLVSYAVLGGRCAYCRAPISARYPLVELITGLLTAVAAWRFGFGAAALCAILISWFLIALTCIDLDHQLLPDSLTLPLLWLGLVASAAGLAGSGHGLPVDPVSAIVGATAGYLCLWAVYHGFRLLTGKEGMGHGDFKLLAALGAWLGWQMLLPIVLLSAGVGAVVGLSMIALRRTQRGTPIPFGPFLAGAGWIAMLWGPEIVRSYLGLYRTP
jgi:leader peptidase (prepilin peptidase)/N-methyltransferase